MYDLLGLQYPQIITILAPDIVNSHFYHFLATYPVATEQQLQIKWYVVLMYASQFLYPSFGQPASYLKTVQMCSSLWNTKIPLSLQ